MKQETRRGLVAYVCAPLLVAAGLASFCGGASAAAFTPGNLAVYRVGDGSTALANSGNAVFIDEYTPAGVRVQSIALPTTASGAQKALVASGTAATDGLLTRSSNGNCLAVPGYGRDLGGTGSITSAANVPRVVGRITAAGAIDTSTALNDVALGTNFRSAASTNCIDFWASGGTGTSTSRGVHSAALGATTSTDLSSGAAANVRVLGIFGGQLYASASGTGVAGLSTIGSGTPTATAAVARLPGLTDTNSPNNYGFAFADLSSAVAGMDTLYVADVDGTTGGVRKFSLVSGSWVPNGTVGVGSDGYRGLTAVVSAGTVTLYATRGGTTLVRLTDPSGYNGSFSGMPATLATAGANTMFGGVTLAPEVTVTPSAGANGSITQNTPHTVAGGSTVSFTVAPNPGYAALVGGTCGGSLVGTTYTTNPVTANCSVDATFTLQTTHLVTPSAAGNGNISPGTPQTVLNGATTSFTVAPQAGHYATLGGSCGGTLAGTSYTTHAVTAACSVDVVFTPITYTITPSAGSHGTISPGGVQTVNALGTMGFNVTPEVGYSATVGGTCGGTLSGTTYNTLAATADCTVSASFTPLPMYTVTVSANSHGTVSPAGTQQVQAGATLGLTVTPDAGYRAVVRGSCGGVLAGTSYVSAPISAACQATVSFSRKLVLFQGNSYTFGRIDPVMSYNTNNVTDLTMAMWQADPTGSNPDEPHPWGGIPGVFKKFTDQMDLGYDVSISARNAASIRGHYLNSNPANWDLRGNIASQRWDVVVLQDLSDEPMPAGRSANANLPYFRAYADKMERWIHVGNAETFTETQLFGNGSVATCIAITGASANACNTVRSVPTANPNASAATDIYLYSTWARPDMIGPNGTNPSAGNTYYSAAEGLEAMTLDLHNGYFDEFAANGNFKAANPVGDAFLRAVTEGYAMRDPYAPEAGKFNLWHTDYFHSSKYGSYLSALVHFAMITGMNPRLLGAGELAAADLGITSTDAVNLQEVARLTVLPAAPTSVAALAGSGQVSVDFTAPANIGGLPITGYTATCGAQTASGSASPLLVTGVPNGVAVTCTVAAANTVGTGPASSAVVAAGIQGSCGQANGVTSAFSPAANLCSAGNASGVTTSANAWTWSCMGSGGGNTASCSAPRQQTGTGTGAGGVASSGGAWVVNTSLSAGFIPTTGHAKSPPSLPPGVYFPHGLVDFTLDSGTPGTSATVVLTFPAALPANTVYWKYGKTSPGDTPHWYVFHGAVISGPTITLTLTDGGAGDEDGTLNGFITDPGGPGVPAGLEPTVRAVPSLSAWGVIGLVVLMLACGLGQARRRYSRE